MGNTLCRKSAGHKEQDYRANGTHQPQPPAAATSSGQTASADAGLPAIRPPSKTKSRLIPNTDVYENIQRRVKNVSGSSVQSLATSLTRDCPDDLHKVRAIFCWIAANITYDVGAMSGNDAKPQEPDVVLRTKRAVCQGYSQLFSALCGQVSVPCLLVSGLDKGLNYDPESVFTAQSPVNHAWNIVFVKGEWRPLDVTWGTGHLDQSRRFEREFTEHWFLTDPAEFVSDHFPLLDGDVPKSEKYQLLKRPVTLEEFSKALRLKPSAYDLGLGVQCLTHKQSVVMVRRDVTITLKAPSSRRHHGQPLENVRVTLTERARRGGGGGGGGGGRSNVLTWLDVDGTCQIYVRPPRAGIRYDLRVMGKGTEQMGNTVSELFTYIIDCTEASKQQEPFPDKEETWGLQRPQAEQCGLKAVKGARYSFRADRKGEVRVSVPLSLDTTLVKVELTPATNRRAMGQDLERYTQVESGSSKAAIITARLPSPGYFMLRVYAGQPHTTPSAQGPRPSDTRTTKLQHCADYLLHSDRSHDACAPFPKVYTDAQKHRVHLLSPSSGLLPAGQRSLFRLRAPGLGSVRVGGVEMVRGRGGVWEGELTPPRGVVTLTGAVEAKATTLHVLFEFEVK